MYLNTLSFERCRFETACQSLMAAMYLAENNDARLEQVEGRAIEQGNWIDDNVPEHRLSRYASGNNPSVYESAKLEAAKLRRMLKRYGQL